MKKERNNTIELFRFIFSIGFVFGHMAIIFNRLQGHVATEATTQYALDTLAVFIIIAGFFMMKGFRKDVLLGETDDTLKLLVALENTEKVKITDYNSFNDCDCIDDRNSDAYSLKVEDVKKTYLDMFGEELTNLTNVISDYYSYFYNEFNNLFYAIKVNYNSEDETEYYVYFNNYNSLYEHPDKATVNVSVLAISKENDGLYTISDIYGDAIVKYLSSSEVETYVKDVKNYKSNDLVTYLFNNNSSYRLTFSSIIKKG